MFLYCGIYPKFEITKTDFQRRYHFLYLSLQLTNRPRSTSKIIPIRLIKKHLLYIFGVILSLEKTVRFKGDEWCLHFRKGTQSQQLFRLAGPR